MNLYFYYVLFLLVL